MRRTGLRPKAAILLALLLAAASTEASSDYYAQVIRSIQPLDQLVLEKFLINGTDVLGRLAGGPQLSKSQYNDLPRLSLSEVYSIRVANGRLLVRTRAGEEVVAVPRNFKPWPPMPADATGITHGSNLTGRVSGTGQKLSMPLADGLVIYVYTARPGDDSMAFALVEIKNTQEAWESFLKRFPASSHVPAARQSLAAIYLSQANQARARFEKALVEKKPGYRALSEAREWFERVRALNVQTPAVTEFEASLGKLEGSIAERLQQARLQAENHDFAGATQTLDPIVHFADEFPKLAATLEDIRQLAANYHRDQARQRLAQKQFEEAVREVDQAATYKQLPELAALRQEIETARAAFEHQQEIEKATARAQEAVGRGNLAEAVETLLPLVERYPNEAELRNNFSSVLQNYRGTLLSEVVEIEKLHTPARGPADQDVLLKYQQQLTRLAQFDSSAEVSVWRDRLNSHLAEYYHQQALKLAERNTASLSPLAFALLLQAYQFALNKSEITEFGQWQERLERELRIRVALDFRDLTPTAGGQYLLAEMLTQIGSAIQGSGLPNVEILEARRAESVPHTIDFVVELLQSTVRDEPKEEPVTSEYSAGMRQVPNPAWRDGKVTYDKAQDRYEQLRARIAERRKRKYAKKQQDADAAELARAEAELKTAKDRLDGIPAFVEQEDLRSYEFVRRTITRTAEMRLSYRWVNALTGVREVQQLLEDRDSAQAVEVTGVQPADKRGNRNQPVNLPDAESLRGRLLRKIEQQLADRGLTYLKSFIERDFDRARQKVERSESEAAAEDYLRFLFNSAPDDARRAEALEYLLRQFRLVGLADWLRRPRAR